MITTKYKVLKVLIENQKSNFDKMQLALEKSFPDMSWQEIKSYLALLKEEKYIVTLYADNEINHIDVNDCAYAKLCEFQELSEDEKTKNFIEKIIQALRIIKPF